MLRYIHMNPNNKTWQDVAREVVTLKNSPYSDQSTLQRLIKSLETVNTANISKEDLHLLNKATWN